MPKPIICAHRGLEGIAPENTIAAFAPALERGMAIELDVQMTSDRQLVIIHDPTIDRTTDSSGPVSELSLADVKALDAGSWFGQQFAEQRVPTLDEVLELVGGHQHVSPSIALDLKDLTSGIVGMICDCFESHELTADVVGFGKIMRSAVARRQFAETLSTFHCAVVAEGRKDLEAALGDRYSTWVYARFVTTADDVNQVHRAGKRLIVCGAEVSSDVNCAHEAYKAGPDVVLSFHPSRLAELTR